MYDPKKIPDYVWPQRCEKMPHFSQTISVRKKLCTSERPNHFCLTYSKQTSSLLHGEMISLATTPTISMNQIKRGYTHNQIFGGGQLKLKHFGFFAHLHVWAAYSADAEQHVQQEKVKMEKERMAFWSWSFQIIPGDFSVILYTVLVCFVIKWVNQSSQILNSLKKYWLVELCQLGKKMAHWLLPLSDKGKCSFSKRQNWWPFLVDYEGQKAEGKIQQLDREKLSWLKSPWTASGTKYFVLFALTPSVRFTDHPSSFIHPITIKMY